MIMKKNLLITHLEKMALALLVIILIILVVLYLNGIIFKGADIEEKLSIVKFSEPSGVIEGLDRYEKALKELQAKKEFTGYQNAFIRDSFFKYVEAEPPKPLFELRSIERLPLNIQYNGFIEYTGGIIGQINLEGTTHFVKESEELAEYKILELNRKYAVVEDASGKKIRLPLREEVLSDDYEAMIYLTLENRTTKVMKGDKIKNFQVLDILPTYVVLFNQTTGEEKLLK
jgi:hypothetical protein